MSGFGSSSTNNRKIIIIDLTDTDDENSCSPIPLKDLPNEMWKEILQYCEPEDLFNFRLVNKTWKSIASKILRAKMKILDLRFERRQVQHANEIFENSIDRNDFPVSQISVRMREEGIVPFMQNFGHHLQGLTMTLCLNTEQINFLRIFRCPSTRRRPNFPLQSTWSIFYQILLYCQNLKQISLNGMGFSDQQLNLTNVSNPIDQLSQSNLKMSKLQKISIALPTRNTFSLDLFKRFLALVPAAASVYIIKDKESSVPYHLPVGLMNQILDELQKFAPKIKLDFFNEFYTTRDQRPFMLIQKLISLQPVPIVNENFLLRMNNMLTPEHNQAVTEFLHTQTNNFTSLKIFLNHWKFRIPVLSKLISLDITFPKYEEDKVYLVPFRDGQLPCLTNVKLKDYCEAFALFNLCCCDHVKSLKIKYGIGPQRLESRWDLSFPNLTKFTLEGPTEYLEFIFEYMNSLEELVFKFDSKFTSKDINDVLTGFKNVNEIYEEYEIVGRTSTQKLLEELRLKSRSSKPSLINLTNLKKLKILYADPYSPITDAGASFSILLMHSLDYLNLDYSADLSQTCSTHIESLHNNVSLATKGGPSGSMRRAVYRGPC